MVLKYIFVILSVMLLCSVVVTAEEPTDVFNVYNVPACYEIVLVQVVSNAPIPYSLVGCSKLDGDIYNWQCPCQDNITLAVPQGEKGQFDFRFQYYISKPRPVTNVDPTILDKNQLYNSDILRVVNIPNFSINEDAPDIKEKEGDELIDFIFFLGLGFIVLLIIGTIFYVIAYGFRGSLKRWLRLESDMLDTDEIKKDEDTGIKAFFMAIFRRDNLERKSLTPKGVKVVNEEPKNNDSEIEQEALDILRSLEE